MPGKDVRIQVGDALLILAGPGGSCKIDTSLRRGRMDITLREFARDDIARLVDWVNAGGEDFFVAGPARRSSTPLSESQAGAHLAEAEGPEADEAPLRRCRRSDGWSSGHAEFSRNRPLRTGRPRSPGLLVGESSARARASAGQIVSRLLDVAFGEMALHRGGSLRAGVPRLRPQHGTRAWPSRPRATSSEARRAGGKYWNAYYMAMARGGVARARLGVLTPLLGAVCYLAGAQAQRAVRRSSECARRSSSRQVPGHAAGGCTGAVRRPRSLFHHARSGRYFGGLWFKVSANADPADGGADLAAGGAARERAGRRLSPLHRSRRHMRRGTP